MRRFIPSSYRAVVVASMLFVLATLWIWALANAVLVTKTWEFDDVHAYVAAAQRLLDGGPLYISASDTSDLYLYAPWFAYAWIPFVSLPPLALEVAWAGVLLGSMWVCLWRYWRSWAGLALALLLGGLLYRTVGWGNVQALVLAALMFALPTRAGPLAVGVAASIKPWPLLAVGVYAWRRDWRAVAVSLGTAAALWAPILFFNWPDYPVGARPPNVYDATFLLAAPALLGLWAAGAAGSAARGQRAPAQSGSPADAAG